MSLKDQFEAAVAQSKSLKEQPGNDILLRLYSLYKQATEGVAPAEPTYGMFDFVGKAKYDAWKQLGDLTSEAAMEQYIALVASLK
jgi:diazepam-binding inhibitor (GABA receptor modulating acyl-CoA-binding protein)